MAYDEEDYPRSEHTWGRGRYDRDIGEGRPVRREMREYEDREWSDRDRWRGAPGGEPDYDRARGYGGERWDRERGGNWGGGRPDWDREPGGYRGGADWGDRERADLGYGRPDYERGWNPERGRNWDRGSDRERFSGRGNPDYENWNEPDRGHGGHRGERPDYGGRTGGYADLGEGYGGRHGSGYESRDRGYERDREPNDRDRGWRDREWWSNQPRRGHGGDSGRDFADRGPERDYQDRAKGYQGRYGGRRNRGMDRDYGNGEWGRGSSRR